ncbi:uncharacterized protein TNCV_4851491 [Trichonephila clavipes]|nr:uncharacterized protein TNCV_4851491 [Trichonephila clavipes]
MLIESNPDATFKSANIISTNATGVVLLSRGATKDIRCTLNRRRAASPLVWWVEGEQRWKAPGHALGFLPLNWGGTEQNCTVTCMVLKAKANDRHKSSSP